MEKPSNPPQYESNQLLPPQRPPNPTDAALAHDPKLAEPFSPARPREILHRVVRLHPQQQVPRRAQHIHAFARAREHVPIARHLQPVRRPVLREVEGALVGQVGEVGAEVEGVDGAPAGGVEGGGLCGEVRREGRALGAGVGDVDGAVVGREGDAVGLRERVVDQADGACLWAEAVGGRLELRGRVGELVEPAVGRVGEPDVARARVHEEVVDRAEVVAEVVVQDRGGFVRGWVERSEAGALLEAADAPVAARCSPIYEAVGEGAAVGSVDGRVGEEFR